MVFAPHVETASGMILPDDYLRAVADAVHAVGGLFVLDCIASGAIWVDMAATGVDVLISAPQKGWSSSPCCALVMLGERGARAHRRHAPAPASRCDLKKWLQIMETYEKGGHAYHATMPTDALAQLRDVMQETAAFGFDDARAAQQELGTRVRALLAAQRHSRASPRRASRRRAWSSATPSDADFQNGKAFVGAGPADRRRRAAGSATSRPDFKTFRIGLFGLDKLRNLERTVASFERALDAALKG